VRSHVSDIPTELDWQKHALFLDFDGTLTPIVGTPDAVVVSSVVRNAVERLIARTGGALAIISGRALVDLERHLGDLDCTLSGSHGLELRPRGASGVALADVSGRLNGAIEEVSVFARRHDLIVESKPGAVTLHYRSIPTLGDRCRALVDRVAMSEPGLRAMHGNMVSEVVLADIHKGSVLTRLMTEPPFRGRVPIMAGDDVTDEDAFHAVAACGGFAIKIGPGPTVANHRAADIDAFLAWLCKVADVPEN
jgi:trehalose 6-phosphate phosphatase